MSRASTAANLEPGDLTFEKEDPSGVRDVSGDLIRWRCAVQALGTIFIRNFLRKGYVLAQATWDQLV